MIQPPKALFLFFLMVLPIGLQGMEKQVILPAEVTIEDHYGNTFTIPASQAKKCGIIQNSFNFEPDRSSPFERREIDFDDGLEEPQKIANVDISFFQQKATDIPLSRRILKTALDCIDQPKKCTSLTKDNIRSVFAVINYLNPIIAQGEPKRKAPKKLVKKMKELIPTEELSEENEVDHIVLTGMYEKSVNTLLEKRQKNSLFIIHLGETSNYCITAHINLSSTNITSLRGIDKITEYPITCINVSDNKLEELDVGYLQELYPSLCKVDAGSNYIKKVIFPKYLPENFSIQLDHNNITELPEFHTSKTNYINLNNNPLSDNAHETIKRALKPPFLKRNRHYFYLLKDLFPSFFAGSIWSLLITPQIASLCYINENPELVLCYAGAWIVGYTAPPTLLISLPGPYLKAKLDGKPETMRFVQLADKLVVAGSLILSSFFALSEYNAGNLEEYKKHKYHSTTTIVTDEKTYSYNQ